MTVQQLFEAIGNIDDRFIDEAASDAIPHVRWKIAAVAAAAAAVIAGTVLYSTAMLNRPTPPQDLAAPIITAAPTETAQPGTDPSSPVNITPEQGGDQSASPAQPTPNPSEGSGGNSGDLLGNSGSGSSGSGIPGFGGSGAGLPGAGFGGSDPPGTVPGTPQPGQTQYQYLCRYSHSAAGDYLIFCEPIHGIPVYVKNITGQIVDGHYSTTVTGLPFGAPCHVQLQVYDDGSYDLTVN